MGVVGAVTGVFDRVLKLRLLLLPPPPVLLDTREAVVSGIGALIRLIDPPPPTPPPLPAVPVAVELVDSDELRLNEEYELFL